MSIPPLLHSLTVFQLKVEQLLATHVFEYCALRNRWAIGRGFGTSSARHALAMILLSSGSLQAASALAESHRYFPAYSPAALSCK